MSRPAGDPEGGEAPRAGRPRGRAQRGQDGDPEGGRSSPVLVDVLEGLGVVDGKHAEEALAGAHVLVPHGAVLFLAGRVQDVQQTRLPINDHLLPVGVLREDTPQGPSPPGVGRLHPQPLLDLL